MSDGYPVLRWSTAATARSMQSAILQDASPAPAHSIWFAPGDRLLFTQGFLESSWSPRAAETLAIYGLNIGADQLAQSAVKAGVAVTGAQLIKNKNWRPAFTTCMSSLIGLLPDDKPSATDAEAAAFLRGASTVFTGGVCAGQLAAAKERMRVTEPLVWAPLAKDLGRLEKNTTWVQRVVEGFARFLQAIK